MNLDGERVDDVEITLSKPCAIHQIPDGIIHGMANLRRLAGGALPCD
jgi:hypothetical protein